MCARQKRVNRDFFNNVWLEWCKCASRINGSWVGRGIDKGDCAVVSSILVMCGEYDPTAKIMCGEYDPTAKKLTSAHDLPLMYKGGRKIRIFQSIWMFGALNAHAEICFFISMAKPIEHAHYKREWNWFNQIKITWIYKLENKRVEGVNEYLPSSPSILY